jgi:hypothetical protein
MTACTLVSRVRTPPTPGTSKEPSRRTPEPPMRPPPKPAGEIVQAVPLAPNLVQAMDRTSRAGDKPVCPTDMPARAAAVTFAPPDQPETMKESLIFTPEKTIRTVPRHATRKPGPTRAPPRAARGQELSPAPADKAMRRVPTASATDATPTVRSGRPAKPEPTVAPPQTATTGRDPGPAADW